MEHQAKDERTPVEGRDASGRPDASLRVRHVILEPLVGLLIVIASIAHTFTNQSIVHFRDLAHYSLPFTQWMRRTVHSGHFPIWNSDSGLGFSAISDPTLQLLFPPTVLLRLLLPESLGLNLSVGLAIPVAFAGAYLLLCRRADMLAATTGAVIFALSGPMLSAANMLNLGWSAALAPFVILAAVRAGESDSWSRVAMLSVAVALQALAGEPMTFVATIATALALSVVEATTPVPAVLKRVGFGLAGGIALASIQLVPLAAASLGSARGGGLIQDTWSLHPMTLVEAFLPGLFGSPLDMPSRSPAWYRALNGGRDPLLLSIYVGWPVLALAAAALVDRDRRRRMTSIAWMAVLSVALVLALGDYTPIVPLIREYIPGGSMARFPSKFTCIAALAIAAMTCAGIQALVSSNNRSSRRVAFSLSAIGMAIAAAALAVSLAGPSGSVIETWTGMVGLSQSDQAQRELATALWSSGITLLLSALAIGAVILLQSRLSAAGRSYLIVIALVAVAPLVVAGPSGLVPMLERSALAEPEWLSSVTVGGRIYVSAGDALAYSSDVSPSFAIPPGRSRAAAGSIYGSQYPVYLTGLGLRDAVTTDLSLLRPSSSATFMDRFELATLVERRRALGRLGVTDLIVPFEPTPPDAVLMRRMERLPEMAHWTIGDVTPRVFIAHSVEVRDSNQDAVSSLFSDSFNPLSTVALERGGPAPADLLSDLTNSRAQTDQHRDSEIAGRHEAEMIRESPSTLVVRTSASDRGGWLVINDAWAEGWVARVDGVESPVLRANGVVRAVRIDPGIHTVEMTYRPRSLIIGLTISISAAVCLLCLTLISGYRRSRYRTIAQV